MDDAIFTSWLFTNNVLPGDLKGKMAAPSGSSAEKAATFLDHVIKPSVAIQCVEEFNSLLKAMKNYNNPTLKKLAEAIDLELNQIPKDKTGI